MKIALVASATALLLILGFASAAQATSVAVDTGTSGSAVVPDNSNITIGGDHEGGISPFAVKKVGGGTWNYGSRFTLTPPKTCWSNYKHNTRKHSSTAIMGKANATMVAKAGKWSEATVAGGTSYTCYAQWWRE